MVRSRDLKNVAVITDGPTALFDPKNRRVSSFSYEGYVAARPYEYLIIRPGSTLTITKIVCSGRHVNDTPSFSF